MLRVGVHDAQFLAVVVVKIGCYSLEPLAKEINDTSVVLFCRMPLFIPSHEEMRIDSHPRSTRYYNALRDLVTSSSSSLLPASTSSFNELNIIVILLFLAQFVFINVWKIIVILFSCVNNMRANWLCIELLVYIYTMRFRFLQHAW